jgi:hypothetical protein
MWRSGLAAQMKDTIRASQAELETDFPSRRRLTQLHPKLQTRFLGTIANHF